MKFWKKRKPKTYKTRTSKQKVDELLSKTWLADLREHPGYAREIARQRFGFVPDSEGGDFLGEAQPDILDVLRQAREAKDLIREEVESEKGGGTVAAIAEIVKALPTIAQILPQLQQAQPAQPVEQPRIAHKEPEQLAEPEPTPEPKSPQEAMVLFANRFMELESEVAAAELFQHKDESGDVRSTLWAYLSENSLDECLALIPELITIPEYAFLAPFAQKLSTNRSKRWLALLIDEVNRLKTQEIT